MASKKKNVRSRRASRANPPHSDETNADQQTLPPSEAQELAYFRPREGREWTPIEVDTGLRVLHDTIDDADDDAGRRIWRVGDRGFELYNGWPERTKGFATFRSFLIDALQGSPLGIDEVEEALRVRAGVPDVKTAGKYGRKKLTLGLRLMDHFGLVTFEALTQKDLPQQDGSTCRFPATVRKLQEALKILKQQPAAPAPSKKLLARAARLNEGLAAAKKEEPALANFRGKYVARDGDVFLDSPPLSTAQRHALARLIPKIEAADE